jgi:hypothetical protein
MKEGEVLAWLQSRAASDSARAREASEDRGAILCYVLARRWACFRNETAATVVVSRKRGLPWP